MDIVVELRDRLEEGKEVEERAESAVRSMEAQQVVLQEAEVRGVCLISTPLVSLISTPWVPLILRFMVSLHFPP